MECPADCRYTKEHEWVRVEDGVATFGITEFAQSELGDIVFVELPDAGSEITKGDSVCVVESTKAASDVYAPISGKVKETNAELESAPDTVNSSPFADGWLVKIEGFEASEIEQLMSADEYKAFVAENS